MLRLSACCGAGIYVDPYGHRLCSRCWQIAPETRDLIAWLFPPEPGPRPSGEPVFIRYGRRIELHTGPIRGRPDAWSWTGA